MPTQPRSNYIPLGVALLGSRTRLDNGKNGRQKRQKRRHKGKLRRGSDEEKSIRAHEHSPARRRGEPGDDEEAYAMSGAGTAARRNSRERVGDEFVSMPSTTKPLEATVWDKIQMVLSYAASLFADHQEGERGGTKNLRKGKNGDSDQDSIPDRAKAREHGRSDRSVLDPHGNDRRYKQRKRRKESPRLPPVPKYSFKKGITAYLKERSEWKGLAQEKRDRTKRRAARRQKKQRERAERSAVEAWVDLWPLSEMEEADEEIRRESPPWLAASQRQTTPPPSQRRINVRRLNAPASSPRVFPNRRAESPASNGSANSVSVISVGGHDSLPRATDGIQVHGRETEGRTRPPPREESRDGGGLFGGAGANGMPSWGWGNVGRE